MHELDALAVLLVRTEISTFHPELETTPRL